MSRHVSLAALVGAALLVLPLQALPQIGRWHDRLDVHERWLHHANGQRGAHERGFKAMFNDPVTPPASGTGPAPTTQQPVAQQPVAQKPGAQKPGAEHEPDRDGKHHKHDRHDRGPEKRLVEKYDRFAGSDENARELVNGLRNDTQIELSKGGTTTKFTPATGEMGWGNVDHALALAKASLAEHGIHNPSPDQVKAALNGGSITTKSGQRVTLPGVLKLRASGMGWGQIAHKLDVKHNDHHDDRKHDHKHAHKKHDHKHGKHDHDNGDDDRKHGHKQAHWKHDRHDGKHDRADGKRHDRPDFHRAKHDRPHRPDKIERPDRHDKPHRPERPERHHHRR